MKKVLVFPCGSEIGLEILRSLKFSTHFSLVGASSVDDHGKYEYEHHIGGVPFVNTDTFIDSINKIIDEYDIDYVFPAHDDVVVALAKAQSEGALNCTVVTSSYKTCYTTRSKAKTYKELEGVIEVPTQYAPDSLDDTSFPVFLKPDVGQGSKGTQLAKSKYDLQFYMSKDDSLLCMEYLPGKEYTIDCFTDFNGDLRFAKGRQRKRISNGISVDSSPVEDERFGQMARAINDQIALNGAWFYQVKERPDGTLVLMEIAPRIAGTMGLTRVRGVNLPLLSLFNAAKTPIVIDWNDYDIEIDRALENRYKHNINYSHVYIDFDDLLFINQRVNPSIVAFLYQCINEKISLHLLTRHGGDLNAKLAEVRLTEIFDEIIWLKDGQAKSSAIVHKDAIFIDDSHAERYEVKTACGIPVFDAHMVEALIRY